ncbi:hypothetical protein [Helicobacter cappadocius]|uniref:Uncharacterized protein n=1 Tax=Helicobacter cappadocius TaxID=3063998 RepID=A0AA90PIS1_9HELI|nr:MULTISPECIES: hypothetical protein [unclassified Helicobacter]MDO7252483.1 hypothetical protein [Helicobacter sp. faydin-H75]MDP2538350.1 hypothetical protein [Helicobacter sp. faydin-H76]
MNKNQLEILEKKFDKQKSYIQQLESQINLKTSEIVDIKSLLEKAHLEMKKFDNDLDHILNFILILEDKIKHQKNGISGLQDYIQNVILTEDKNMLFGVGVDRKFIKNKSISTIKYYLYTFDCFIKESYKLENLKVSQKKDASIIIKTLIDYIKISFKNKNIQIKGIIELSAQDIEEVLSIRFYGNYSIEEEIRNFIALYSQ